MKSKHFLQLIIFCLTLSCVSVARAAPVPADEARKWSEEKGMAIINALSNNDIEEKYRILDNVFENYVDIEHVARFVVGKYWKEMNQKQREQYVSLFQRYSLALYKGYPLQFDKDTISYNIYRVVEEENYTLVLVNLTVKGFDNTKSENSGDVSVIVEFRLHKKDDKILLSDLKIAETSFLLTYRSRFYEMINRNDGDMGWFLEDLETATISIERNNLINNCADCNN